MDFISKSIKDNNLCNICLKSINKNGFCHGAYETCPGFLSPIKHDSISVLGFKCDRCRKQINLNYSYSHPTELMGRFCHECFKIIEYSVKGEN